MLMLDGHRPWPISKKNRRLVLTSSLQGDDPCCEVPHDTLVSSCNLPVPPSAVIQQGGALFLQKLHLST